jgi:hypothetical protein
MIREFQQARSVFTSSAGRKCRHLARRHLQLASMSGAADYGAREAAAGCFADQPTAVSFSMKGLLRNSTAS